MNTKGPKPKHPFATIKRGGTFIIPAGSMTKRSVAAYICKKNNQLGRKFVWEQLQDGDIQVTRKK